MSELKIHSADHHGLTLEPASFLTRLFLPVLTFLRGIKLQRRERLMRLCETLPLGEKRFLAIVQIEHQRFLIATTNQSISLLHCLESSSPQFPHTAEVSGVKGQDGVM